MADPKVGFVRKFLNAWISDQMKGIEGETDALRPFEARPLLSFKGAGPMYDPALDPYNAYNYLRGTAARQETPFVKYGWMSVPDLHAAMAAATSEEERQRIRDYMARPSRTNPQEYVPGSTLHGFKDVTLGDKSVKYQPLIERNPITGQWDVWTPSKEDVPKGDQAAVLRDKNWKYRGTR